MLPPQGPPAGRPRGKVPQPAPEPRCPRCHTVMRGGQCQNYGCESPVGKVPAGEVAAHLRPVPGKVPAAPATPTTRIQTRNNGIALSRKQKQVTPTEEVAFATIEVEMGGRQKLLSTLSAAQLPADIALVLGAIGDPDNDRVSLARICAQADVSLAMLLKIFQAALLARGQLQAQVRIATKLPDVAAAVMDDAVPEDRVCRRCLGAQKVSDPTKEDPLHMKDCPKCDGVGTIRHIPDHDVQKTALKLGKLLDSGGMRIAVNQQTLQVGGGADTGSYDKLISALDSHLYGHGRDRLHSGSEAALEGSISESTIDAEVQESNRE